MLDQEQLRCRIRDLREAAGLSQRQVAGKRRSILTRMETGSRDLTLLWAERIAAACGVSLFQLFDGIGTPQGGNYFLLDDGFTREVAACVRQLSARHRATVLEVLQDIKINAKYRKAVNV